jgi:hypothetical protein
MVGKKIKQAGRAQAVSWVANLSIPDMREVAKCSESATVLDTVVFVRKIDPSLKLADATALAKGIYSYLNEKE